MNREAGGVTPASFTHVLRREVYTRSGPARFNGKKGKTLLWQT